jgi:hypothetical protein
MKFRRSGSRERAPEAPYLRAKDELRQALYAHIVVRSGLPTMAYLAASAKGPSGELQVYCLAELPPIGQLVFWRHDL